MISFLWIGQGYPLSCAHWVWKDGCLHPAHCAKDSAVKGSQSKPAVSGRQGAHSRPHKRTLRASERPFEGTVLLLLQGDFVCAPAKRCRNWNSEVTIASGFHFFEILHATLLPFWTAGPFSWASLTSWWQLPVVRWPTWMPRSDRFQAAFLLFVHEGKKKDHSFCLLELECCAQEQSGNVDHWWGRSSLFVWVWWRCEEALETPSQDLSNLLDVGNLNSGEFWPSFPVSSTKQWLQYWFA